MNSKEIKQNSLHDTLVEIQKELEPKGEALQKGLDKKLKRTSKAYEKAVQKNCEYILSRSNYKVLMAIDRHEKKKEKEDEDEEETNYGFIETY